MTRPKCTKCGQELPDREEYNGRQFLSYIHGIVNTVQARYSDINRHAAGVAFHILTMLDNSGESGYSDRYRVQVDGKNGWEDIKFMHNDWYRDVGFREND